MKIFDMHIHTNTTDPDPSRLLAAMEESGTYGGCIFSTRPLCPSYAKGLPFDDRLRQIFRWCEGNEDRLFPVVWLHPDEEDVLEKVRIANEQGVSGFKFICTSFYPSEDRFIEIAHAIAETGKPMFLHSGIHYSPDGFHVDLDYNRPAAFTRLATVPGLRFSMGHCSWPWIDECIALFGKIMHRAATMPAGTKRTEMYLDLTPGTPEYCREELLYKLYSFSQNTGDFILHGTDQVAEHYDAPRVKERIQRDRAILDRHGVSLAMRERAYSDNLMRFLGKKEYTDKFVFRAWNFHPYADKTKDICRKWYQRLGFSSDYDAEFERALREVRISDAITVRNYDKEETDGRRNLLSFLFFCEELSERYAEKGIDEQILLDTLGDVRGWTDIWSAEKGSMHLGELLWLSNHLDMKLFRIGSLEYIMGKSRADCPALGVKKGENVIDVHIPHGAALSEADCRRSLHDARLFFAQHYPEFSFTHFHCYSWLLDTALDGLLGEKSNIRAFRNLFHIVEGAERESYAALRYIFTWGTNRINLRKAYPVSSLAERVKRHVLGGGRLYERVGLIRAEDM